MTITINCRFCSQELSIRPGNLAAPRREAVKFNCPHCNSRMALDLNVRRISKSAGLRRQQEERRVALETAGMQLYNGTPESVALPWENLSKWDRGRWIQRARDSL